MKYKIKFIIPITITIVLLLGIYLCQGLYPFGNKAIVQVDADYQYIPVLYRIYDFLHGNSSIIYDDIGLGNNIYISMIIQGSIFSPLSLLLYFTTRSNIINFYNIIIIVKLCLLSLTSYIYINKTFKVNEFYKIIFSVLYTFSGWILLNYFNIMWIDSVILFPLIIMYLNKLLEQGKYLGYTITLSFSLIISYYISYFILLFILFYSFLHIFLKLDKEKIKITIFKLGMSTIIAILISSFSLLPALYQTFISSRFNNSSSNVIFYNFINKSIYLIFSTTFLALFLKLILKYKKDRKNIYIYILLFILFSIGILVEPINLSLHMGSYWSFPYRYSFITLFILLNGSLYYLEKHNYIGINKHNILRIIVMLLLGITSIYLNNLFYQDIVDARIILDFKDLDIYIKILIVSSILLIMNILSFRFKDKLTKYIAISMTCLIQVLIYSSWTMYYNEGYFLTKNSNDINNNIKIVHNDLERYKMGYITYTPDYGFIYQVNTLDNWLHILPSQEIETYKTLGYKTTSTCIRSYGGTIFTDWLFNVGYIIDTKEKNNDMYKLVDKYDQYYLYKYNYNNNFGITYNNKENIDYNTLSDFELQNKIYREIFDQDKDIIKVDSYNNYNNIFEYQINTKGFLYIELLNDIDYIKVNNTYINYKDEDYIIDLGFYEDDVTIEINGKNPIFSLGFIKYNDIIVLKSKVNKVTKVNMGYDIVINNNEDEYLFLPINNIPGLKATINNKKVEISNYINNFVSIKLNQGNNDIKIRYEMPLFKIGIVLTILGIVILLIFNKIDSNKLLLNLVYYLYIITCIVIYLYHYGCPFIKYYSN